MKCTHYACRCARAHELAQMEDFWSAGGRFIREAIAVHDSEVECRIEKEKLDSVQKSVKVTGEGGA